DRLAGRGDWALIVIKYDGCETIFRVARMNRSRVWRTAISHRNLAMNRFGRPDIAGEADGVGAELAGLGVLAITNNELVVSCIELQHEVRLLRLDTNTSALPDSVVHQPLVLANHIAALGDDVAGNGDIRPMLCDEIRIAAIAHQADFLAFRLIG